MQISIEVKDENIARKILKILDAFVDEGVRVIKDNISSSAKKEVKWTDEYIDKHWREIGMGTHSADLDDDERLYEAAARFYDEKHSS